MKRILGTSRQEGNYREVLITFFVPCQVSGVPVVVAKNSGRRHNRVGTIRNSPSHLLTVSESWREMWNGSHEGRGALEYDRGRDQVWPNPSLAKSGYQVWPNQVWPRPSLARPSLAKTKFGQTKFGQDQVWPDQVWPRPNLARPSEYSPCFCEGVAGRRPATPSHKHGLCPPFGFQRAFMWSIAGRTPAMLHMRSVEVERRGFGVLEFRGLGFRGLGL